ncbi:MAG: hypothetical protein K0U24_08780 [Gammaproteobacteria bacterium]|nr:hypothetical protein [Gammaproteobacteria bacterium]MCH9764297.1 hypothetical protein [Gammaproteobacteria bacterium]
MPSFTQRKLKPYETMEALWSAHIADALAVDTSEPSARASAKLNHFEYRQAVSDNHTLITKHFNQDSYSGPTQNDFLKRFHIINETVRREAEKFLSEDKLNVFNSALDKAKNKALAGLQQCGIEPIKINDLLAHEAAVISEIKRAQAYIAQFIADAVCLIPSNSKTQDKRVYDLAALESKVIAEKGRPNFINYYSTAPEADEEAPIQRVSIQRVVGDAIPSTERGYAKLPNFVECGVGYIDKESGDYVSQFTGYRHSSYPPIRIENKILRRAAAGDTVKEMLTELAKKKLAKRSDLEHAGSKENPIKITLSSLALLTPISSWLKEQYFRGFESESRQLKESHGALMAYDDRVIEVHVGGRSVWIRPDINLFTAPSNAHGKMVTKTPGMRSGLEQKINRKWMRKFISQMNQHLDETSDFLLGEHPTRAELVRKLAALNVLQGEGGDEEQKMMRLYLETLLMQMDRQVEPGQVGARYLILSKYMGHDVDFYCKSGEDRTGRVQNLIEEMYEFSRRHGYFPRYDSHKKALLLDDTTQQQTLALYASEFSVSRDITGENAHGARGLQLGLGPMKHLFHAMDMNVGLPNDSGDVLGKTAKGVYSGAIKLLKKKLQKVKQFEVPKSELPPESIFSNYSIADLFGGELPEKYNLDEIQKALGVSNQEQIMEPKNFKLSGLRALSQSEPKGSKASAVWLVLAYMHVKSSNTLTRKQQCKYQLQIGLELYDNTRSNDRYKNRLADNILESGLEMYKALQAATTRKPSGSLRDDPEGESSKQGGNPPIYNGS